MRPTQELSDGARFWALERSLCTELAERRRGGYSAAPLRMTRECVDEAVRLKSFDYRLLNLLMYAMRRVPPAEQYLEFLATAEVCKVDACLRESLLTIECAIECRIECVQCSAVEMKTCSYLAGSC